MRMRNGQLLVILGAILGTASDVQAQSRDSLYRKAQELVANGDATTGRALIDSLLHATSPDSGAYADALYWHAVLAVSAADAELAYRRIIVDYPTSPRVEDALMRIGQLELTRGEYDEALQHLQRLPAEHPSSPLRAKASYWIARTFFEKNDVSDACAANADALAHVLPSDVELKNQIDYQQPQCRNVAVATPKVSPPAPETPAPKAPTVAAAAPKDVASASKPVVKKKHDKAAKPTPPPAPPAPPPVIPAASAPSDSAAPDTSVKDTSSVKPGEKAFAVQVAAYYDRTQADALAAKLQARGYTTARVEGTKAPFRVRIGRFKTHAAAAAMLATLQAKKITGFVAEE
jgi:cell division protein FtsN